MKRMLFIFSLLSIQPSLSVAEISELSSARQNELLYFIKHDCGSCHGMTLKGGLGPALSAKTLSGKPESYLISTIMEGRANTAMPAWKSMFTYNEAAWITRQLQNGSIQQTEMALTKQSGSKP